MLLNSPKKSQTLAMLEDPKRADQQSLDQLERMIETLEVLRSTPRERVFYKLLPWLIAMAGLFALYTGIDAIWSGEVSTGCAKGLRAQLQGAGVVGIGLVLMVMSAPESRLRSNVFWVLGAGIFGAFVAYLGVPFFD